MLSRITARLSRTWQSLLTDIGRFGLKETLLSRVLRGLTPWLRLYRVASRPLGNVVPEPPKMDRECRILTAAEAHALPDLYPTHFSQDFVNSALSRGDICLGAFAGGQLVAWSWRTYTTAPDNDGLWVRTAKPYRYSYKAFTLPEYRGQRVLTPSVSDPYCTAKGYTHMVGFVERHNLSSLQRHRRRPNYIRLGYAIIIRLFGHRWILNTPGLKRVGFELHEPT